jgi:hypothetical protein
MASCAAAGVSIFGFYLSPLKIIVMISGNIDTLIQAAHRAVFNTLEDENFQQLLKARGFTLERILEGQRLVEEAQSMDTNKGDKYDAWSKFSKQLIKDRETALATFLDHVKVTNVAFRRQPEILTDLKISKINRKKTWDWIPQAQRYYMLIEKHTKVMKQFGVAPEELDQAKAGIEALLMQKNRKLKKKAMAESATKKRNKTLEDLNAWLVEFRYVARLAFKHDPQMLEAFGMKVPS